MTNPRCEIGANGTKRWFNEKGEYHRLDGPAFETVDGTKVWYVNGKLHRLGAPAREWANGSRQWWVNGKLHRTDGPAFLSCLGQSWWVDNKLHRLDGPAIEYCSGTQELWVDNKKLTKEEFNQHPLVVFYRLSLEHR
jgi:hypothetical protein